MPGWTLEVSDTGDRVFSRPLGCTEQGFYWDSQFNGTADIAYHAVLRIPNGNEILSKENVERTWVLLKRRYPLLGARLRVTTNGDGEVIALVVEEASLLKAGREEVTTGTFSSEADALIFKDDLLHTSRSLSNDLLSRLYIFSRADDSDLFHFIYHIAHLITDGIGNTSLVRNLLQALATKNASLSSLSFKLEERLALSRSLEEYSPSLSLSRPHQMWRRAIARVMQDNITAKRKGGHTLPRTFTTATPFIPAHSRMLIRTFSVAMSDAIIASCRKRRITLVHALPIIAQVAHSRVMQRLRQDGKITEEEWQYRKHQPMYSGGPLNMRPYLDAEWFRSGGAEHLCLSINFFNLTLPHMPLGRLNTNGEIPSYSSILSEERFFLRCRMMKAQNLHYLRHPLFIERANVRVGARIELTRQIALEWQNNAHRRDEWMKELLENAQSVPIAGPPFTPCNAASSIGNLDAIFPLEYPIPRSHPLHEPETSANQLHRETNTFSAEPAPVIQVLSSRTSLRCRPGEFYLWAEGTRGQIRLGVFWDENVFEAHLIEEWLDETTKATEWFLGQEDRSAKL